MLSGDQKKKELGGRKTAISERVESAVRRAQQEISSEEPQVSEQPELPFYDQRSNEMEQSESAVDRMMWSSTSSTTISEDEPTQM